MMFWDSSALVPLVIRQPTTDPLRRLLASDDEVLVWALSPVEISSAIWRRRCGAELGEHARERAENLLNRFVPTWETVVALGAVAQRARRLLAIHPLRAGDSLQLAAALLACEENTKLFPFVTLDTVLGKAAAREGFTVLPQSEDR